MNVFLVEPLPGDEPVSPGGYKQRLQELIAPILVDDRVEVAPGDPVGGGPACEVVGCPRAQEVRSYCITHYDRWRIAGRPDRSQWQPGEPPARYRLLMGALPTPMRWEIAYGILRAREMPGRVEMRLPALKAVLDALAKCGADSLLAHPEYAFPGAPFKRPDFANYGKIGSPFLQFTIDELDRLRGRLSPELEFGLDVWRGRRIGFPDQSWLFDFRPIEQLWLREAVKKFLRWRKDIGHSASGMHRDVKVLIQLSRAMSLQIGPHARPEQFDRAVITRFLTLLVEDGISANGRAQRISSASRFLAIARQHDWIPEVPARTAFYSEEVPARPTLAPKGLSSVVMAQLETAENLDKLGDPRWRLLFPLLIETGLRINDALNLPQDCVVHDQHHAPYLRYYNRKMNREAMVPISTEMATEIAEQCRRVQNEYSPRAVLFPRERLNRDGSHPALPSQARTALREWLQNCRVLDEAGAAAYINLHQFRHTLGTKLINNDVPQEVVRKILDHSSTEMTAHYARLHDTTVRRHWERARKVDITGTEVNVGVDTAIADAEWAKHHLGRATMALSNGYCGLPLQQSCPHANACLTCPVFITTPEFLPQHREQLDMTRGIIDRARQRGQLRVVEMNQRTADNLLTIISSLETPSAADDSESPDAR